VGWVAAVGGGGVRVLSGWGGWLRPCLSHNYIDGL